MLLKDKLVDVGGVFFKYRSYIPLILVILIFLNRGHFLTFKVGCFTDGVFEAICFAVSLFGFGARAYTVGHCRSGTSGRNTKGQYADSLNRDGIYSVVRNPLYIGNFFIVLGIAMLSESYQLVLITILLTICFYIPIILAEEHFLFEKFKDVFAEYAKQAPALAPNFKLWKKPEIKFNTIRFLAREHDSYMGIMWGFFFVKLLKDYTLQKRLVFNPGWTIIFIVSLSLWIILKFKKKYLKSIDKGL